MPRPRGERHRTRRGSDPVTPHADGAPREKDLEERERRQTSRRKAPGPERGTPVPKDPTSSAPPTDPK